MRYLRAICVVLMGMVFVGYTQAATDAREQVNRLSDEAALLAQSQESAGIALADEIWNLAELGYLEFQSSAALQNYLRDNGFQVHSDGGGIPTAFVASYRSNGADDADPVIAILAEFDALLRP